MKYKMATAIMYLGWVISQKILKRICKFDQMLRIYKALELIGKGSFGQVISIQAFNKANPNLTNNVRMAMKIFKKQPAYINQGLI